MRLSHVVNAPLSAQIFLTMRITYWTRSSYTRFTKKLDFTSQNLNAVPEDLGGNSFKEKDTRQPTSLVHNARKMDVETEIIHIGRKSHNECAVINTISNRSQKAIWDWGAGRCVMSLTFIIVFTINTKLYCSQAKSELKLLMALLIPTKVNMT